MTARYIVGDTRDVLATLPDNSVDLIFTSPPFLALRSYLPADHPDKHREIGSEPTPADFLDTLLDVVEACDRVLAPHGSLVFELGDTYSGSGGAGGDYNDGGLRDGQNAFNGSARRTRTNNLYNTENRYSDDWNRGNTAGKAMDGVPATGGRGWPMAKSLCFIPTLFGASLAYGRNLLRPERITDPWRIRNLIVWCLDGDTVVYARTPKGVGPTRLLHLAQNWQPGQWELWDGDRWTPVLGWSATEADDAIEIEFRNGERISATREHQWPTTRRGLRRTDELQVGDVVPHVRLPDEGTERDHLPDYDIGWLVGTFLADGSFDSRDRIQISGHRDESARRLAVLRRIAESYDGTATAHDVGEGNEATVVVRSPILAATIRRYIGGTSAHNKHLAASCWRRNNAFLAALVEGYLDGDGYWDAKNERWRLGFTDNGWLARDLRVACARLGYRCRIKRFPRAADPRGGTFAGTASHYWRGEIRMTMVRDHAPMGEVVALRTSKRRRFFDIGVEGDPHLFALGSGILTHNCRPNPPVGALGDKVRPATSYLTVACKARDRYFDLDAVRTEPKAQDARQEAYAAANGGAFHDHGNDGLGRQQGAKPQGGGVSNVAGAPPLDYWEISTQPYKGSHYATFPERLCEIPIKSMVPERVCTVCGEPSRRITGDVTYEPSATYRGGSLIADSERVADGVNQWIGPSGAKASVIRSAETLGWSDCGHDAWRKGICLDPFAGSGTTLAVAVGHGREAIGIDLDSRNAELARERVGLWLTVDEPRIVDTAAL